MYIVLTVYTASLLLHTHTGYPEHTRHSLPVVHAPTLSLIAHSQELAVLLQWENHLTTVLDVLPHCMQYPLQRDMQQIHTVLAVGAQCCIRQCIYSMYVHVCMYSSLYKPSWGSVCTSCDMVALTRVLYVHYYKPNHS